MQQVYGHLLVLILKVMIRALRVPEVGTPRELFLEHHQRIQRPGVLPGDSLVGGWWHLGMPQLEDSCVNTVRLELHGQGKELVRFPPPGVVTEEYCGCVSARESPVVEGWEVNEHREGLVGSS